MRPIIVRKSKVPRALSLWMPVAAITLWPFVFIRDGAETDELIRHESIHIAQCNECLVIGFYGLYLWDWLKGLIKYRSAHQAYRQIRFEQEAYEKQSEIDYLSRRTHFAWTTRRV